MADEFEIEKIEPSFLSIRHLPEGHRYTFHVAERDDGRHILSDSVIMRENSRAAYGGLSYQFHARTFAEREARKAGMID
jgi:hypothetical protein